MDAVLNVRYEIVLCTILINLQMSNDVMGMAFFYFYRYLLSKIMHEFLYYLLLPFSGTLSGLKIIVPYNTRRHTHSSRDYVQKNYILRIEMIFR
jgi:hypothetical protein